jgi:hypothetical protein
VYSIQHHEIKFVNDLRQVGGFIRVPLFPPPILTATIIKILLKMVLNTISLNPVFDKVHMIAASFKYSNLYNQLQVNTMAEEMGQIDNNIVDKIIHRKPNHSQS